MGDRANQPSRSAAYARRKTAWLRDQACSRSKGKSTLQEAKTGLQIPFALIYIQAFSTRDTSRRFDRYSQRIGEEVARVISSFDVDQTTDVVSKIRRERGRRDITVHVTGV